jgi:hypothetical protein
VELDSPANVEGGGAAIADQIGRARHSQQAEGQPPELGVLRAPIIALADPREELVRGERQTADVVDLVDEEHDPTRHPHQHDVVKGRHPALQWSQLLVLQPEVVQLLLQIELVPQET